MKKAHIISHSHWDREWYLPFEKHNMLLVEFMDSLIGTMECDEDFKSFYLDGQTILLQDYLRVRPDMKDRLTKLIQDDRIVIGPWYVLQDEFLTSNESNIRNLQTGHRDALAYGKVCKLGYFPDSFGNMGQAPQILKEAGIETAVFGRGVTPTGFNNQVGEINEFESPYSEMYWESKDGSKVLGILFANWYCNGNEVPTDKDESKTFWDTKLKDAEQFASTDHLLFMNGCDHQPVQTDLSSAIAQARELYPDVEFIHSNFTDYIESVKETLPDDLEVIRGELRSQETSGWYTLANTASARVYLKQMNAKCEMLFTNLAEPLATMAYDQGKEYPHHIFEYGWKLLMENHPHDSICGCSVDSVHREMVSRFEKAQTVAEYIIEESMNYLNDNLNNSDLDSKEEGSIPILIANTTGWVKSDVVTKEIKVGTKYFSEGPLREVVNEVKGYKVGNYKLVDDKGNSIPVSIKETGLKFDYDLPKDSFRLPHYYQGLEVTFEVAKMDPFSLSVFTLVPVDSVEESKESLLVSPTTMENKHLTATIKENGSLDITHKSSGHTFTSLGIYEDHGDIGNEYIYMMPVDEKAITTKDLKAEINVIEDTPSRVTLEVIHEMMIPASAEDLIEEEIQEIIEFKERKSQRVDELIPLVITTKYSLDKNGKGVKAKASFDNKALDHRLRVLFETKIDSPYHYADSIFEVAKRDNTPSNQWENPCNAQHQQKFVNLHDENIGLTIANKGLNEYEVLRDGKQTIAVTLHRGMRELGDWGVFRTPEAQCLGEQTVEFEIIPHGAGKDVYASYEEAYQFSVPFVTEQANYQDGSIDSSYQLMNVNCPAEAMYSSLKVNQDSGDIIGRWYNLSSEEVMLDLETDYNIYTANLLEEKYTDINTLKTPLGSYKILTLGFAK